MQGAAFILGNNLLQSNNHQMKKYLNLALGALLCVMAVSTDASAQRYVGGDISLLPEYEKAGATYKDMTGKPITDLIPWCAEQGMNAMRVRLFVNPEKYKELHANDTNSDTRYDPNACQSLEEIIPLCKRIVESGMALMLDFHYSDTWADPAKQWTPIDWEGLTDPQLYEKIYEYTRDCLLTLKENGIVPSFIQTGNEISYGMLWGPLGTNSPKKTLSGSQANWARLGMLLKQAGKACREVCPTAKIVLHTERVAQVSVLKNFYDKMKTMGVEYEIIGLSYYPYFHGDMNILDTALSTLQTEYPDKEIMIVETGYSYKWEVPGTTHDLSNKWPYSAAGQKKFAQDLVDTLLKYDHTDGLFWWWMEYNAFNTSLSGWYNAPLFDSTTGRATLAFQTICSFGTTSGVEAVEAADENPGDWYTVDGQLLGKRPTQPGIYIHNGKKVAVK